jgi:hypothetical protein
MDKAKKRIASALDGFRNNLQTSTTKLDNLDIKETLSYRDFALAKVGGKCARAHTRVRRSYATAFHTTRAVSPMTPCSG